MKFLCKNLAETQRVAQDFLDKLLKIKSDQAVVVGLFGDLGSGKTTFTQAVGRCLDVKEVITSPTFVIEKRYDLEEKFNFKKLIHIDAYRLEGGRDILNLDFAEDINNPDNLILIEWPELIKDALPEGLRCINFRFVSENEREIEF